MANPVAPNELAVTSGSELHAFEFPFTRRDFQRVRELILAHAGISLAEHKHNMVYTRLARRVRAAGCASFSEYLKRLEAGNAEEWEAFVNALTTNLTSFFREPHHFETLGAHLKSLHNVGRTLDIWCCASSTGEEAYSIAMTAMEAFGSDEPPVRILASDIDTQVLEAARDGVYPLEGVNHLGRVLLQRYFFKGTGEREGFARVKPEVQRLVSFRQINLLDCAWQVQGPFDAIFCRNVMIYFDRDTQLEIVHRFAPLVRSDGLLFVGHSENFATVQPHFRFEGKTVYRKA